MRELLLKADCLVKESSYSLSRLIRWEVLLVDIFQHRHHGMISSGQSLKDLAKKAKSCITSLQLDQDIHPRYEVVANCSTFLLTTKDWDYLISIDSNNNGALQVRICSVEGFQRVGFLSDHLINYFKNNNMPGSHALTLCKRDH